jgi:hypothetical protein
MYLPLRQVGSGPERTGVGRSADSWVAKGMGVMDASLTTPKATSSALTHEVPLCLVSRDATVLVAERVGARLQPLVEAVIMPPTHDDTDLVTIVTVALEDPSGSSRGLALCI